MAYRLFPALSRPARYRAVSYALFAAAMLTIIAALIAGKCAAAQVEEYPAGARIQGGFLGCQAPDRLVDLVEQIKVLGSETMHHLFWAHHSGLPLSERPPCTLYTEELVVLGSADTAYVFEGRFYFGVRVLSLLDGEVYHLLLGKPAAEGMPT